MRVAIIDYGSGNLRSVARAFEQAASRRAIAADIAVTDNVRHIRAADRIVLPGVGAYADCRRSLDSMGGMVVAIEETALKGGRPFLGICVGMQLLSTRGFEKQQTRGLNWIQGDVVRITPAQNRLKVPQIGWNTLEAAAPHPLLRGIPTGPDGLHSNFVHSYHFVCADRRDCLATTDYGGPITAAVVRGNLAGTQFHPEKSQRLGLELIANFLEWRP